MLTETLLRISFIVIGRCSLVPTFHRLQGKCTRINLSPEASGMILQNHHGKTKLTGNYLEGFDLITSDRVQNFIVNTRENLNPLPVLM
jgi:hypothetical protein